VPTLVKDISGVGQVACGSSHTIAVAQDGQNEVYAWGNNTMGQCGQGHTSTPIAKPKKVLGLEGISIQQITAGTSHSLAWTAVPTDSSSLAIVRDKWMLPLTFTSCFLDFTNTCLLIATSVPALR
uniref:Uncharacterized protein n=1 Tax=Amphilophus citrinellus TaxID=61819 RepID=A0A3Q0T2B1_AMPCI